MINIFQRDDFTFPKPLYGFGQTVYREDSEEAFIIGMKSEGTIWEYELFYVGLEVIGVEWVKENEISSSYTIES